MNEWLDVHALVDDELIPNDRLRVQELIKSDRAAETEWQCAREIKTLVSAKCVQHECDELWKTCSKRLQEIERTKRVESFVGRYAWAFCGAFALVILTAAGLNRANGGGLSTGDVERVSASMVPISAPRSQTPDDVKQWLQANMPKTTQVKPGKFVVLRGALGRLSDGRKVGEAELQDSQGPLKLYVVEHTDKVNDVENIQGHQGYSGGTMDSVNCITWTGNGNAYVLEGDRSIEALCETADALSTSAQP